MKIFVFLLMLLRQCWCLGKSKTEELTAILTEATEHEISPPTPEVYAHKDIALRARWEAEGVDNKRAPRNYNSIVEELAWTQWHHPMCHGEAHDMGKRLFTAQEPPKTYHDTFSQLTWKLESAVNICEYRCTGGCLHGALGAFVVASVQAKIPLPKIGSTLGQQCISKPLIDLLTPGECAHTLGHAIIAARADNVHFCNAGFTSSTKFWTTANMTSKIQHDEKNITHFWGPALAHYCAGGVFMEDYSKQFSHLRLSEIARRCRQKDIPSTAKAACFYYGLRHYWKQLGVNMLTICGRTNNAITASCVFGAASGATILPVYRKDISSTVRLCEQYHPDTVLRRACIDGLVFRADKFFADEIDDICGHFRSAQDRSFCVAVARAGMYCLQKRPYCAHIKLIISKTPGTYLRK